MSRHATVRGGVPGDRPLGPPASRRLPPSVTTAAGKGSPAEDPVSPPVPLPKGRASGPLS